MLGRMIDFMEGENAVSLSGVLSQSNVEGPHYEQAAGGSTYVLLLDHADTALAQRLAAAVSKTVTVTGYKLGGYTTYQRGQAIVVFGQPAGFSLFVSLSYGRRLPIASTAPSVQSCTSQPSLQRVRQTPVRPSSANPCPVRVP